MFNALICEFEFMLNLLKGHERLNFQQGGGSIHFIAILYTITIYKVVNEVPVCLMLSFVSLSLC